MCEWAAATAEGQARPPGAGGSAPPAWAAWGRRGGWLLAPWLKNTKAHRRVFAIYNKEAVLCQSLMRQRGHALPAAFWYRFYVCKVKFYLPWVACACQSAPPRAVRKMVILLVKVTKIIENHENSILKHTLELGGTYLAPPAGCLGGAGSYPLPSLGRFSTR